MQKSLFIFGAGASKKAGIPLMNEFLNIGLALNEEGKIHADKHSFDLVDKAKTALCNLLYSKINIDLGNIEDVFGLIEMGKLINRFPGCKDENEIEELHEAIIKFIVVTIEHKNLFSVEKSGHVIPVTPYHEFTQEILLKLSKQRKGDFSLMTFNYDIALDWALYYTQIQYDYCLDSQFPEGKSKYIKLHGSINWGICPKCKQIRPVRFDEFWKEFNPHGYPFLDGSGVTQIDIGSKIGKFEHLGNCQTKLMKIPLLVPPTWNKTHGPGQVTNVWKHAAEELSSAENIFIVGYSLPRTDIFFKYLLGLGTMNPNRRLKKFWIFNPDESIKERYEEIKGQGIESFQYYKMKFEESLPKIKDALHLD